MRLALRAATTLLVPAAILLPVALPAANLTFPGKGPQDAVAVISVSDTKGIWNGFAGSPVKAPFDKLMANPQIKAELEQSADALEFTKLFGFAPNPENIMTKLLSGFDAYILPPPEGSDEPLFVVAAKLQSADQAQKLLDKAKADLRPAGAVNAESAVDTTQTFEEFTVGGSPAFGNADQGTYIAALGDTIVFSNAKAPLESFATQTGGPAFLTSDLFKQSTAELDKLPHQVFAYGNGDDIAKLLESAGDPQLASAAGGVKGQVIAFVGNVAADQFRFSGFKPASTYKDFEKELLANKGTTMDAGKFAGDNSLIAWVTNSFKPKTAIDAAFADPVAGGQAQMMLGMLEMSTAAAGFSLRDDFLNSLGNDHAVDLAGVLFNPMMGQVDINMVIALEVENKGGVDKAMSGLENMLTQQVQAQLEQAGQPAGNLKLFSEEDYSGTKIRTLDSKALGAQMPIDVSYAQSGNYLLIGMKKQTVKDAIDRAAGKKPNFSASKQVARAGDKLQKGADQVAFIDIAQIAGIAQPFAFMLGGGGASPEEQQAITDVFELVKSFGTIYTTSSMNKEGARSEFLLLPQVPVAPGS